MMYLYSGGEQKKEEQTTNVEPVIIATITSPDYAFFDYFTEESNILVDEEFNFLTSWTVTDSGAVGTIHEISPAGEFHGYVIYDGGIGTDYGRLVNSYKSTNIPTSYTLEFELKMDVMGTDVVIVNSSFQIYSGSGTDFGYVLNVNGVYVFDGATYTQIGTVVPTSNGTATYQKWRIVGTSTGETTSTSELFLETAGTYVSQGSVNLTYALASPLSDLKVQYASKDSITATEIHLRNIKLYYT
jgi:hypothetical protein